MTIKELRQLSAQELPRILKENQERLRELRFKVVRRELKKVRDLRATKKTIAKVLTLLQEDHHKKAKL